MRLIDADKLHYIRKWFEDSGKSEIVVFAKEIDKAEIVDAIPKEWIKKYIHKLEKEDNGSQYEYVSFSTVGQIYDMLNEWEKENDIS